MTNNDDDKLHRQPVIINHSSYYDFKNLIPVLEKNKGFSISSSNIQSINAKINELKIFIEELREKGIEFQVICLQETWLKEEDDTSVFEIEGYKLIPQGYSCSTKGV